MSDKHAIYSPSGAARWMSCAASVALSEHEPESRSAYATEGTAAHELAAKCLLNSEQAKTYVGTVIDAKGTPFTITDDMAENVQTYVDTINSYPATHRHIETKLSLEWITGEKDAEGTADAVIVENDGDYVILRVCDLKYGMGVEVEAEENPQLMMYALAAIRHFKAYLGGKKGFRVILEIHQVRTQDAPSRWETNPTRLAEFLKTVRESVSRAEATREFVRGGIGVISSSYEPNEKNCRFCKAKVNCPARKDIVRKSGANITNIPVVFEPINEDEKKGLAVVTDATPDEELAGYMRWVDTIEDWCSAVREKMMNRMLAGAEIPGWKMVLGRKGHRYWKSADEVDEYMKTKMRLTQDQRYKFKVISPTEAEKQYPEQYAKNLKAYVDQGDGKPKVVLATEKGVEYKPAQVDFIDLEKLEQYL